MNLLKEWFGRGSDAGLAEVPGAQYVTAKKPIRVRWSGPMLHPIHVRNGDTITGHATGRDEDGRTFTSSTPAIPVTRAATYDRMTMLEITDEFGMEVGVGLLIGASKK